MSDSLRSQGSQHARFLCPRLSPGVCSTSCPLGQCFYLTISSSAAIFAFCLQSFPASWSFPMSQLLETGSQSIGTSASASVLSMTIQGWFPLVMTGLISLQSRGFLSLLQQYSLKASILRHSAFYMDQLSHLYMTTGKTIALIIWTCVGKMMSLLFNTLFRFVRASRQETPKTQVWSLGQEDPLEEEMGACSSILAGKIPWTEEAWKATVHEVARTWTWLSGWAHTEN